MLVSGMVARLVLRDGPPVSRTENARLADWIYIDARGRDLASIVAPVRGWPLPRGLGRGSGDDLAGGATSRARHMLRALLAQTR